MSGESPREERPRPEYGEYATPEEQRAAIKQPVDYGYPEPEPAVRVSPGQPQQLSDQQQPGRLPDQQPYGYPGQPTAVRTLPQRRGDRFLTYFLLALGLIDVVRTATVAPHFGSYLASTFSTMGVAGLTASAVPPYAGYVVAVFGVVAWLVTVSLVLRGLRRGRLTFWIPLIAGAAVGIVEGIVLAIVLASTPGLLDIIGNLPSSGATSSV